MTLGGLYDAPLWVLYLLAAGLLFLLVYVLRKSTRPAGREDIEMPDNVSLDGLSAGVQGQQHPLHRAVVRIGRNPHENDIVLPFQTVSGRHAEIVYRDGSFYLRDRKSRNGTRLNGLLFSSRAEEKEVALRNGDQITLDTYDFRFRSAAGGDVAADLAKLQRTIVVARPGALIENPGERMTPPPDDHQSQPA